LFVFFFFFFDVFASFFIFFLLDLFFRKNLRLRICLFFYLFFGLKNKKQEMGRKI
jgi:hypothetical protein